MEGIVVVCAVQSLYPSVCPSVTSAHSRITGTGFLFGSTKEWSVHVSVHVFDSACFRPFFSCDQAALWMVQSICPSVCHAFLPLSPSGWRGIVVTVRLGGRAGGCQTCGTHISVTAWQIFSIRSSVELSRPVVVHRHGHLSICPIWAWPWAKNLSNLPQIGSRLWGTHTSETAGWIYPI